MDVVMYGNYIKWVQIYEWMYNLCDYLTYQYFFFSNNVRSYDPQSHLPPTILRRILILTTFLNSMMKDLE